MYRHAMNYWGIKKVENLDPLVKLLLEALSSELFGLSHEIEDSHNRMLDKIANMLTPDTLVHVHPAHGICHALPNDTAKAEITRDTGFFANLPFGKDRQKGKLSLYPVKNTVLYNGDVRKLICSGDIYKLDATMTKELVYRAPLNMAGLYNHTIWIGVKWTKEYRSWKVFRSILKCLSEKTGKVYIHCLLTPNGAFAECH